jgi:hypothetical protein
MDTAPKNKAVDPLETAQRIVKKAQRVVKAVLNNTQDTDVALSNGKEIAQFISAVAQLTRASGDLERVKSERDGAIYLAGRELMRQLKVLLEDRPDLQAQMSELAEQALVKEQQAQARQLERECGRRPMGRKHMLMVGQVEDHLDHIDLERQQEPKDFY